ncbi:NADH-quinone oxidoreductase subunit NuoG [Radicibacter daui]|uniref:NADH-quinone oxidoreductase subunit NuoG n=1 Tax=Radicibacter daui TaxID=3064829 RepID=UPI004046BE01
MPKLTIDGIEIEVEAGTSVLQACEALGIEVPRFCYHERLSVAGNCRMCLVDMERAPKPVASCCMPVGEGMVIRTDTERVRKARNGVMEFLLINHPLDCPICDQGGECDLQDQAVAYGKNTSRYDENKRAVKNKEFGPLIKTVMTRCIHCTRCIRFAEEIAGVPVLGATYRGENMEVGTYVEKTLDSELSGNLVDICPVGALTSKPYAFHARPWELRKFESIDAMDAVGSNIRVDVRGGQVMRVLPRLNEAVNEEWISDKTRHAVDGLMKRRLDKPYVRGADGKLKAASWDEAFAAIAKRVAGLDGSKIGAIAGNQADAESMLLLKELMQSLGVASIDCRQDGAKLDATTRAGYLFNTTIAGIEQADAVLLIGTNPRKEAAIINARLRKRWTMGGFPVGVIGPQIDLTYDHSYLGAGPQSLEALLKGEGEFAAKLKAAQRPMIIVGMGALTRADGAQVLAAARQLAEQVGAVAEGWNGFNVLHTAAARVGGLDLGLVPAAGGRDVAGILDGADKGEVEVVYLLGADEIDASRLGKAFVIYQGHHGDVGAHHADVILPGAAYTEKEGTYVNTEGRVQRGRKAAFAPGDAREDWAILRALSAHLAKTLPYDDLASVRRRLVEVNPAFAHVDDVAPSAWGAFGAAGAMDAAPFVTAIDNFYQTCAISRASATMAECTEAFVKGRQEEGKTGTHG